MSRKIWIGVAAILVALAIHDFAVPVQKTFGAHVALAAIDQYRAHVSPHLVGRVYCRFIPTCSAYGRESVRKYGLLVGGAKAVWRVARCNPWTPMGTYDPP